MLNQCNFIGNLGKDPEIRSMPNGDKVVNLSIGVSDTWKDKQTGERKTSTEWVKVSSFQPNIVMVAENYLKKGSKVFISGSLQTKKWTDKEGVDKYTTGVVIKAFDGKLTMLDSKPSGQQDSYKAPAPVSNDLNDSIPF